jgi:hypothetical protein
VVDGDMQEVTQASSLMLLVRMVLMAFAAVAVAWPLTTTFGWSMCGFGAAFGVWLGTRLGMSRIRHWVLVVVGVLAFIIVQFLASSVVSWDWLASMLGGRGVMELAELFRWGIGACVVLAILRASATRYPATGVLELLLPLLAAASLFSSHREGNIHRPQQLVDFAVENNQDPTWYLRLLGVGGALFLAVGLLRLRKGLQIFGGMALIFLLMLGMFLLSTSVPKSTFMSLQKRFGKTGKEKTGAARQKQTKGKKSKQKQRRRKKKKNRSDRKKQMQFAPEQKQKRETRKPVAVVIFKNDYVPPSRILYFRQRIMSQFNGVRMVRASRGQLDRDYVDHFPVRYRMLKVKSAIRPPAGVKLLDPLAKQSKQAKGPKKKGPPAVDPVKRLRGLLKQLAKEQQARKSKKLRVVRVRTVVAMMSDNSNPFGLVSPLSFQGLPNPNPRMFLRSYETDSLAWTGTAYPRFRIKKDEHLPLLLEKHFPLRKYKVGEAWWPKEVWSHYTRPPDDPRYKQLYEKIQLLLANSPVANETMAKAYAIKHWLERNAAYSMNIRTSSDIRDHVAHFLFKSKVGYCVHFSHAAVYLMRHAGVPARIAEGYAVPLKERGTSSALLIRAGASHAWPEIYLRGFGWVPFDIYPQRNLDSSRPSPPDPKLRQMLAKLARPKVKRKRKKLMQAGVRTKRKPWNFAWLAWFVRLPWFLVPIFLLLGLFGMKWWRRWSYLFLPQEKRTLYFYRSLEDRLSEQGLRRAPGETLEQFAEEVASALPSLGHLVQRMSAQMLGSSMVFKGEESDVVKALNQQFRAAFPWYWRVLRAFDPISWSQHILQRWRYFPPIWWIRWLAFLERVNQVLNRVLFLFRRAR